MTPRRVIYLRSEKRGESDQRYKPKKPVNIDGIKYFTEQQIRMLRRSVRDRANLQESKGLVTGIREWMVIDLLTSSGVRVSEAINVRCGDLKIGYSECELFVRHGNGMHDPGCWIKAKVRLPSFGLPLTGRDCYEITINMVAAWFWIHRVHPGNDDKAHSSKSVQFCRLQRLISCS